MYPFVGRTNLETRACCGAVVILEQAAESFAADGGDAITTPDPAVDRSPPQRNSTNLRGSEWRKWDLHIHTPTAER